MGMENFFLGLCLRFWRGTGCFAAIFALRSKDFRVAPSGGDGSFFQHFLSARGFLRHFYRGHPGSFPDFMLLP